MEYREKSGHSYPLLFSKEGQEYMGVHITSIKTKVFKVDYYFKNGYISYITYTNGVGGCLFSLAYSTLGYLLQLIPVQEVRDMGIEIVEEVASTKKKYIHTGSSANISSRMNPKEKSLKAWLESYLVRNGKGEYVNKIKWNEENLNKLINENT